MNKMVTLEQTRIPYFRKPFENKYVYIWSNQWKAYWRPRGAGYTDNESSAGIFKFKDALNRSGHCGPEKQIQYHKVSRLRCILQWLIRNLKNR